MTTSGGADAPGSGDRPRAFRDAGNGEGAGRGPQRVQIQRQARALGDPTRFAIFQHVASEKEPTRVAALTDRFGLNHNAVRQHLAKLCDADLLVEEVAARSGPGRPALQYRLAPGVAGTWNTQGPYEQLALLLLEVITTGSSPRAVGSRAGERAALGVDPASGSAVSLLVDDMRRRGFEPRRVDRVASVDVVLDHCPFSTAASADPGVVCEIHRGLAEGFLAGVTTEVQMTAMVVRSPDRGGCELQLRPVQGARSQT